MKQSSKRLISISVALIFVIAAFVCFFDLVQPTYSNLETLRSKQIGESNYLKDQTAIIKQAQSAIAAYQNEAQGAGNVALAMPSGQDIAGALAQVQGIALNNGIALGSIAITPPAIQLQASGVAAANGSSSSLLKPLGNFTLKITGAGSYESFKNFLSELETNIRIFDVKDVSLQPAATAANAGVRPAGSRDVFNYAVTVATYYQTQ